MLNLGIVASGQQVGAAGTGFLDDIVGLDVCMQVDATKTSSYGGSGQTFANLIASPSDGSAQTDEDFWLGADGTVTTNDPTFVGTAGTDTAYFNLDGADWFKGKTSTPAVDAAVLNSNTDGHWLALAFKTPATPAGKDTLMTSAGGITAALSKDSFILEYDASENVEFLSVNTGGAFVTNILNGFTLSGSTDYLIVMTWDASVTGATNCKLYVNSNAPTDTSSTSFGASTSLRGRFLTIGAYGEGSRPLDADTRIYGAAYGQGFLTDALATSIRQWYIDNNANFT